MMSKITFFHSGPPCHSTGHGKSGTNFTFVISHLLSLKMTEIKSVKWDIVELKDLKRGHFKLKGDSF